MNRRTFRRFGWAVYFVIALIAVVLLLLASLKYVEGTTHEVFVSLSSELLGVAVIFFFVNQFFSYDPEEEQHKQNERDIKAFKEQLEKTQSELKQVEQLFSNLLTKSLGGKYLRGTEEIYNSALHLYDKVQKQIRVVQIASGPRPPDSYAEATAQKLQSKKMAGIPIKFEAVLILNTEKLPPDFAKSMNKRYEIYEKYDVGSQTSVYLLDMKNPIGFTVFIVDRTHAHISLTTLEGINQLESAIEFENQPLIASDLADWFDQIVLRAATPYNAWYSEKS